MPRVFTLIGLGLTCLSLFACTGDGDDPSSDVIEGDSSTSIPCSPECDDGDPCTIDACIDGLCLFTPSGNCMILGCNSHQLTDPATVVESGSLDPDGVAVKLAVTAGPGKLQDCTAMACEDDNPCCNSCNASLGLFVDAAPLDLSLDPSWGCATDDCMENAACSPLLAGVSYWVWGHASAPSGEDPAPSLDVQSWCIQTTSEGLPGIYRGILEPWEGFPSWELEVVVTWEDAWRISLSATREEEDSNDYYSWIDAEIPGQEATNITVGEADVIFEFTYCEIWEGEPGEPCAEEWQIRTVTAQLKSQESALVGSVSSSGTGWTAPEDGPAPDDRAPGSGGAPGPGGAAIARPPSPIQGPVTLNRIPALQSDPQVEPTSIP